MKKTEEFSDKFFEQLSAAVEPATNETLSARLKSRVYSALIRAQAAVAPLRPLSECHADGRELCAFEKSASLVRIAGSAIANKIESLNLCSVCHARVLGENMEKPPIVWRGCPYGKFQES